MKINLPPLQTGKKVWYGPEMESLKEEWIIQLSKAEIEEIETTAQKFIADGTPIVSLNKSQFPLPTFGSRLETIREKLLNGIGFSIIRGLPTERYSELQSTTIFFGIGAHIGNARSQNAMGHILGHVRNLGLDSSDPKVRVYQTNERQSFHTDSCDVVGLLCLQPAKEGGLSLLVSIETVFNEMRNKRPDLLELLFEPIASDCRGEVPEGMLPYLLIPVLSYYKEKITPFYQRQYIESAQRFEDAPRLTPKHFEALDLFDELCNSPDLNLSMMLEKGDIQFVYNHAMLHDRTSFIDWPEVENRRHLTRLWLSVPEDRPLPKVFSGRYGEVEIGGNRGGITVAGTELCVPWMNDLLKENKRH